MKQSQLAIPTPWAASLVRRLLLAEFCQLTKQELKTNIGPNPLTLQFTTVTVHLRNEVLPDNWQHNDLNDKCLARPNPAMRVAGKVSWQMPMAADASVEGLILSKTGETDEYEVLNEFNREQHTV